MDSIGLQLEGYKEMQAKFQQMAELDRAKFFVTEFKPIMDRVVTAMKNQSPVSKKGQKSSRYLSRTHAPGTLRASIGKKVGGTEIPTVWASLNRVRGYDAWYQHMVIGGHEYGGTRVAPNPFVRRTYEAMEPFIKSSMKTRLENKLKMLMK